MLDSFFKNSIINLGFTRMRGHDPFKVGINQVKLRDFEIPLAGGFYLVEHVSEYTELFRPGKEVETWKNPSELIDKIKYYMEHNDERIKIANAGQSRALKEHTWQHRFATLFNELGIG